MFDRLSATLRLDAPVTSLPGISGKRADALARLGARSVRGLLELYPRRYLDHSRVVPISQVSLGESCTVVGGIHALSTRRTRRGLSLTEVAVTDDTGMLQVVCFNQPWLTRTLSQGMRVAVAGTVEFKNGFFQMTNPTFDELQPDETRGSITPVYPANADISRQSVRRAVAAAVDATCGCYDPLPAPLRARYRLCSRWQAWHGMHLPQSMEQVKQAHRRLLYEELYLLQLRLLGSQAVRRNEHPGRSQRLDDVLRHRVEDALPFSLTEEQSHAVDQLLDCMAQGVAADHLLLGDVGTGKTAVALFGLVAAASNGNQALMMGPTEVLVRQYAKSLGQPLDALGIGWEVLTADTPAEGRADIVQRFASGELSVLFGTHALLEPDVNPARLGLAVVDEQQRFGVEQRQALAGKDPSADRLSLTATPIPRSLALVLFGGQTVSYLHNRPFATAQRTTVALPFEREADAYDAARDAVARGEQAYVICPLVGISTERLDGVSQGSSLDVKESKRSPEHEDAGVSYAAIEWGLESETLSAPVSSVLEHARILQESVFPQARVGVLHGRMKASEKNEVMQAFHDGEVDVLVSTTVVEVGVDVPNATVMIVEDADRFGLAQLHQLRGRVGRGERPGRVYLVSRSKAPQALERLAAMEATDDGFALSEYDLKLRREGDVFGDRQSGASSLKLVNVVRDAAVIEAAHGDARSLVERAQGDGLAREELRLAYAEAKARFGAKEE